MLASARLELLLASSLGLILFGVGMTLLMGDAKRSSAMVAALLPALATPQLALIQADLARAASWQIDPEPSTSWPCALAGRHPRLVIKPRDGSPAVVYATGEAPSPIWRGPVLVRCGPAYGLEGLPSEGAYQNRVVLDGVDRFGVIPHPDLPVLQLELEQRRGDQLIRSLGVG